MSKKILMAVAAAAILCSCEVSNNPLAIKSKWVEVYSTSTPNEYIKINDVGAVVGTLQVETIILYEYYHKRGYDGSYDYKLEVRETDGDKRFYYALNCTNVTIGAISDAEDL